MSYIDLLNANSGAIQAVTVLILVAVTLWYAISTKRMANLMDHEFRLHSRPYLSLGDIDRVYYEDNPLALQLKFHLINVGNVPVFHFAEDIMLEDSSVTPPQTPLVLFPKQETKLLSALYESTSDIHNTAGIRGSIKVVFWASEIPEEKYFIQRNFHLLPEVNMILSDEFGRTANS